MNKILIILSLVLLASCEPSAEEKRQVEMEKQRIEQEASEKDVFDDLANPIAHLDCKIENNKTKRLAFAPSKEGTVSAEEWRRGKCIVKFGNPCMSEGYFTRTEGLYKFFWSLGSGAAETLELNRKDLTYEHQFHSNALGYMSPSYGVCKIVQRSTKKKKF